MGKKNGTEVYLILAEFAKRKFRQPESLKRLLIPTCPPARDQSVFNRSCFPDSIRRLFCSSKDFSGVDSAAMTFVLLPSRRGLQN